MLGQLGTTAHHSPCTICVNQSQFMNIALLLAGYIWAVSQKPLRCYKTRATLLYFVHLYQHKTHYYDVVMLRMVHYRNHIWSGVVLQYGGPCTIMNGLCWKIINNKVKWCGPSWSRVTLTTPKTNKQKKNLSTSQRVLFLFYPNNSTMLTFKKKKCN